MEERENKAAQVDNEPETVDIDQQINEAEEIDADDSSSDQAAKAKSEEPIDIDTMRKALDEAIKQRDEYLTMAQRATADYQNFKRRNSAVRAEAYDDGVRETIAAILPVMDNLERAIAASEQSSDEALASGVQMTLKQMQEALGKLGLEEVPALGQIFDPDIHNAVMRAPRDDHEPGEVLEVFQKGYRVKDRMIRYAMVKIAAED